MNVNDLVPNTNGTMGHYVETAISFTLLSVWVIIAFQSRYNFKEGMTFWLRLGWPVFFFLRLFGKDPYAPTTPNLSQRDIDLLLIDQGLLSQRQS